MARFSYQARDSAGETISGIVQASSVSEAGAILRGEGKFIVKLREADEHETAPGQDSSLSLGQHAKRVKRPDVISFTHQMAVMLQTGVPLTEALECCSEQAPNASFAAVLGDVTTQVERGGEFSQALKRYPRVFPPIMTSLIRASEASGTMSTMLERVSQYLSKERATYRKARSAMMYPVFMMAVCVGVTVFLLTFVLPKFATIYADRGAALPAPTKVLLATSDLMVGYWWAWLGVLIAAALTVVIGGRTDAGRRCLDYLKLNTPVVGNVFRKLYVSRACGTMGTIITAGVSMLDMISIVRDVTNNTYYDELWDQVDQQLKQGQQLSDPLFNSPLFPRSVSQMIYSGEKSGRLGQVLDRIAEFTEEEFDEAVKNATQFIEPVMVTFMGSLIGFVAISLLLPIFTVGQAMGQ